MQCDFNLSMGIALTEAMIFVPVDKSLPDVRPALFAAANLGCSRVSLLCPGGNSYCRLKEQFSDQLSISLFPITENGLENALFDTRSRFDTVQGDKSLMVYFPSPESTIIWNVDDFFEIWLPKVTTLSISDLSKSPLTRRSLHPAAYCTVAGDHFGKYFFPALLENQDPVKAYDLAYRRFQV